MVIAEILRNLRFVFNEKHGNNLLSFFFFLFSFLHVLRTSLLVSGRTH